MKHIFLLDDTATLISMIATFSDNPNTLFYLIRKGKFLINLRRYEEFSDGKLIAKLPLNDHHYISSNLGHNLYNIPLLFSGYFAYLRTLLDSSSPDSLPQVMLLIQRPFKFLHDFGPSQDMVLAEFCNTFLKPTLTYNLKYYLIPFMKQTQDTTYYDKLIRYLNSVHYLVESNSLFYCMLALEPADYGKFSARYQIIFKLNFSSRAELG